MTGDIEPQTDAPPGVEAAPPSPSNTQPEQTSAAHEPKPNAVPSAQEQAQKMQALRAQLEAMPPEQRRVYVIQAVERLKENGLFTPVIRRRFEQGDELHGVLGAMVIQCYALAIEAPQPAV